MTDNFIFSMQLERERIESTVRTKTHTPLNELKSIELLLPLMLRRTILYA